ncbi:sterol O-acyltransferase 1-like isoform X2 [Convolutriloba macropyga]|uniref:sterol O-acyltransferase 1-like isoform X2 n=1 Tax=Convolutriloba macropyga TaxID=536237 RepID=UPI003F526457
MVIHTQEPNTSMELNLDDLRRRLIRKIDVEVKETLESFSGGDDFLLHPGGRIQGKGGSVNDLRSQQGSNENVASTGSGGATSEQHHCDETDKSAAERTARGGGDAGESGLFRRKQFRSRESILTVLLRQSKNIRTIYNIFAAVLVHLFISTCVNDWLKNKSIFWKIEIITWNFGNLPIVITIWLVMQVSTLLVVYHLYSFWATNRRLLFGDVRIMDTLFLVIYISYQTAFFVVPAYLCRVSYQLPPASTLIVILEQLRFLMKVHSFVRENAARSMRYVPKSLQKKPNTLSTNEGSSPSGDDSGGSLSSTSRSVNAEDNIACPDFSCYLYFLFAPTLLYRDEYPMTDSIDWNFVRSNFIQTAVCILYAAFIVSRFIFPVFSEFGTQAFDWELFIQSVFSMILPGTLLLVTFHFMFLHSWLNACAEMLRFADRIFYRDWWTSTSYGQYYRTWNVVVHDFLKAYIMYDSEILFVKLFGIKRSKNVHFLSILTVFLVSALVHEYVIIMAAGFFFPILFIMFSGCGFWFMILVQNNRFDRFQNTIFWFLLTIGMGVLICWYSQEWYAQQNCPHKGEFLMDYLIPRSVACYWEK